MFKIIENFFIDCSKFKIGAALFWGVLIVLVFSVGYYLRAYLDIHTDLALSPYEAFKSGNDLLSASDLFSNKDISYPASYVLKSLLGPWWNNFYLIYILGSVIIFLLGKAVSGKNLGGLLAFFLFAVSSENLLQYTGKVYPSGLCYIATWATLLLFLNYLKTKKDINLYLFVLAGVLAITSYHTGAAALLIIVFGLFLVQLFFKDLIDKKIIISFCALFIIYIFWLLVFDLNELILVSSSVRSFIFNFSLTQVVLIFLTLSIFPVIFISFKVRFKYLEYLPLIGVVLAAVLIFYPADIFNRFLVLAGPYYYSSSITLNNYLAQALLTHVYFILLAKEIFINRKNDKNVFLVGWVLGISGIFILLVLESYYVRIFDYSFPLMFVLFGWYWSKNRRFRNIIVSITIILLIISQLIIYNDPFTKRRYYTKEELSSAQKIIDLNLDSGGFLVSDLRTAGLFGYLGKDKVMFFPVYSQQYQLLFYEYSSYKEYLFPTTTPYYFVTSENMKDILYSVNFETKPVGDYFFNFLDEHFTKFYDDGLMRVYQVNFTIPTD